VAQETRRLLLSQSSRAQGYWLLYSAAQHLCGLYREAVTTLDMLEQIIVSVRLFW
jgi:hypothetical protein